MSKYLVYKIYKLYNYNDKSHFKIFKTHFWEVIKLATEDNKENVQYTKYIFKKNMDLCNTL